MFIVFEGIDGCGKTTVSKLFCEKLNKEGFNADLGDFEWTKEPTFGTEKADALNSPEMNDPFKREAFFLEDRIFHQELLRKTENVVCDRYIWSGFAYANLFSPEVLEFIYEIYSRPLLVRQPDIHVFVDTPVELCRQRRSDVELERLHGLEDSYFKTLQMVNSPIVRVSNERPMEEIEKTIDNLFLTVYLLSLYGKGEKLEPDQLEFLKQVTQNLDKVSEVLAWKKSVSQE